MSASNHNNSTNVNDMVAVLLAQAELIARDCSTESPSSWSSPSSPSLSPSSSHHTEDSKDPTDALSEYEWLLRYEAVRSRMGTFVLSRQTIMEFLLHVQGDVGAAVRNLENAHQRQYTGSLRLLGGRAGDLELPDRVRKFPICYFSTGEQERRQAADLFFLLVAQRNTSRPAGTTIQLASSEALLILDASGWDFEEALRLVSQDREVVAQLLHIRFDNLRTRSGSAKRQLEQDDAALAYYLTLTDRADMHTLQQHLAFHGRDIVAAIADWQQNGVDPVGHPRGHGQTQSTAWIGRRHMIQEESHQIILRPMPTKGGVGAAQEEDVMREDPEDRKHRPYSFIIDYDRDALAKNCPNPGKFLIDYLEKGKYRSNEFDKGKGLTNIGNKPIFDVNDNAHLKHFNNLYRQGYIRPTRIVSRDPSIEWSAAEIETLWGLYAELLHELLYYARKANKEVTEVMIPFDVTEATKKEMAQAIEKNGGEERSTNSVITKAHRARRICKDFMLTFETSNEVHRQTSDHAHKRQDQVDHVFEAIKQEGESLSEEEILAAIERITGPFVPFEWDIDMPVEATPPAQQLPSTGLPAISLLELQAEVQRVLGPIPAHFRDAASWEQATQVVRYYYRSTAKAPETAAMQLLLVRMGLRTLNLQFLAEEEGLAIFEGLARREQEQEGRGARDQLNSLVTSSRQALIAGPASMAAGGHIHGIDVDSFGVGSGRDGWLTDNAVEAGLQTLSLQNTTVVDTHGARLHFLDPTKNTLPAINPTAENIALIVHDINHWAIGIYNTTTQQYHLLDLMPNTDRRDRIAQQLDTIVAHYFPAHEPTQATSRSFRQNNSRDCGLYVIENIRAMDRGMPLREIDGFEARMKILSEIMRLATPVPAPTNPAPAAPPLTSSMQENDGDDMLNISGLYFDEDYFD